MLGAVTGANFYGGNDGDITKTIDSEGIFSWSTIIAARARWKLLRATHYFVIEFEKRSPKKN